jgi:ABC-2 type transport system ATP-binding protein
MDNMQDWIRIENATKLIRGKCVLSNVNVSFERGKIYGFTGENGSGKTMLLRALSGLLELTTGTVKYKKENLSIGVIIENPGFLDNYTGFENLVFLARIRNVISKEQIRNTMKNVGLDPADKKKVRTYSLGMKQRLAFAQAIMEDPDILILDEPFRGLDAKGLYDIRKQLIAYNKAGGTIFLASHNCEEITLCDRCYRMEAGRLLEM